MDLPYISVLRLIYLRQLVLCVQIILSWWIRSICQQLLFVPTAMLHMTFSCGYGLHLNTRFGQGVSLSNLFQHIILESLPALTTLPFSKENSSAVLTDQFDHGLAFRSSVKVTPVSFWLKCINLSKCTKFCSADKLEFADKYFCPLTKNCLMDWQIRHIRQYLG